MDETILRIIKEVESKILNNQELTEYELKMCAYGEIGEFIEKIESEECNLHRYHNDMQTIFKINNQFYAIDWLKGLTDVIDDECYNRPYKVDCIEKTVATIVKTYMPIKE